jgi:hypothetical protein
MMQIRFYSGLSLCPGMNPPPMPVPSWRRASPRVLRSSRRKLGDVMAKRVGRYDAFALATLGGPA